VKPAHSLLVLAFVLGLLALPGCGGTTKTVHLEGPPTAFTGDAGTGRTTATTGATASHALDLTTFRSPTGNIGCVLVQGDARCDIGHREWKPPARPGSCPAIVDYGQGLEIGASGSAQFVCAGDTARDTRSPALGYGSATRADGFECLSATTGMTCRRSRDGHGFFISIQTYRTF
jgi:hypothetical protein